MALLQGYNPNAYNADFSGIAKAGQILGESIASIPEKKELASTRDSRIKSTNTLNTLNAAVNKMNTGLVPLVSEKKENTLQNQIDDLVSDTKTASDFGYAINTFGRGAREILNAKGVDPKKYTAIVDGFEDTWAAKSKSFSNMNKPEYRSEIDKMVKDFYDITGVEMPNPLDDELTKSQIKKNKAIAERGGSTEKRWYSTGQDMSNQKSLATARAVVDTKTRELEKYKDENSWMANGTLEEEKAYDNNIKKYNSDIEEAKQNFNNYKKASGLYAEGLGKEMGVKPNTRMTNAMPAKKPDWKTGLNTLAISAGNSFLEKYPNATPDDINKFLDNLIKVGKIKSKGIQ